MLFNFSWSPFKYKTFVACVSLYQTVAHIKLTKVYKANSSEKLLQVQKISCKFSRVPKYISTKESVLLVTKNRSTLSYRRPHGHLRSMVYVLVEGISAPSSPSTFHLTLLLYIYIGLVYIIILRCNAAICLKRRRRKIKN